ncbi:hypothetical protein D3C80_1590270 [compost metagenome]
MVHGPLRFDAQLHAFGLEQENIEYVQVTDAGAVTVMRIGTGADRERDTQQLRDTDEVIGRDRQCAAQQSVIGVRVGVVELGCVVVLKIDAGRQIQWVVAFIGRLGVIRVD